MKANAPEKLYFENNEGVLAIYSNRDSNDEVEYTRTDAFIEKACEYWYKYNRDIVNKRCCEFTVNVEDFKKYLIGE